MSVYVVMPSKRPPEEAEKCLSKWREMGYKIAVQRDLGEARPSAYFALDGSPLMMEMVCEFSYQQSVWWRPYLGYAEAVNYLSAKLLEDDPSCDWIVAAGDDMLPDPNKRADEIAQECSAHFRSASLAKLTSDANFGVMQPTGDRDWGDRRGPYCDFVAGSPWMGREWCQRINQGKGPLWPGFYHMFADECLQELAIKLGVFWQRQDLTHKHLNWGRPTDGRKMVDASEMPNFLVKANSPAEWNKGKKELERLRNTGFAECMPL
jgi:hypothetical protein